MAFFMFPLFQIVGDLEIVIDIAVAAATPATVN